MAFAAKIHRSQLVVVKDILELSEKMIFYTVVGVCVCTEKNK